MKKSLRIFIFAIILIFIIGAGVCVYSVFKERPIIDSPYTVSEVKRTVLNDTTFYDYEATSENCIALISVYYKGIDVTDEIDAEKFIQLLSKNKSRITLDSVSPYNESNVTWEIEMVKNSRPMHILLGNINVWYESSDEGYYEISDPEIIKEYLEEMVSQN